MDEQDFQEQYMRQMSNSYGQMETVLGADGYKVFIEDHRVEQQRMLAYADRQKAVAATIRIGTLLGILMAMPVIVYLWKWALAA